MKTFIFLICSCAIAAALRAQIIHVPGDYPTIQQGINASNPGDTILVGDGVYYEQINFKGKKPLMVASNFLIDGDTNHINNTIIDGSQIVSPNNRSVVYFISGENTSSILCGFTVQNGKGTLVNNVVQGGGIWVSGSGATIQHNKIINNTCEDYAPSTHFGCSGGGIAVDSVQSLNWVIVQENLIGNNSVITNKENAACNGGGIACGTNIKILDNKILNNQAKRTISGTNTWVNGGGINCYGFLSGLLVVQSIVTGNTISGNQSSGNLSIGGGIYCFKVRLTFSNNTVCLNHVGSLTTMTNMGGGGLAVAACLEGSVIRSNLFNGNSTDGWAGALHAEDYITATQTLRIEDNYFLENHALNDGGALGVANCRVMLVNNVFSHNEANWGGAGYINRGWSNANEHYAWIVNNTFSHNLANTAGGSLEFSHSNPLIINTIFWQDQAAGMPELFIWQGSAELAYCDIDTAVIHGTYHAGPGIINTNPQFVDTLNLTIEHGSPCVDAGTGSYVCMHNTTVTAPITDLAGSWRPKNGMYDIGAYEFGHIIHVKADFPTIQMGINASLPGDTVLVENDTYYE